MSQPSDSSGSLEVVRRLAESLFSLMVGPAALIDGDLTIVAGNAAWMELVGGDSTELGTHLREFFDAESNAGTPRSEMVTRLGLGDPVTPNDASRHEYVARCREVDVPGLDGTYAIVVLEALEIDMGDFESVINAQRISINNLLIHQTLIEEAERRRLGRALHDSIAQELALIRGLVVQMRGPEDMTTRLVAAVDGVIGSVRGVTFELSPPILEDLGIRPAMHWLADHLGQRYGTHISVADDGMEPRLSPATQTIVFRAVRELAINAVKHAGEAEIIISCITGPRAARFSVRDTGTGISASVADATPGGIVRFGLVSVEQQIRGIGGVFEIVSNVGEGTRAVITVPLERETGAAHG